MGRCSLSICITFFSFVACVPHLSVSLTPHMGSFFTKPFGAGNTQFHFQGHDTECVAFHTEMQMTAAVEKSLS